MGFQDRDYYRPTFQGSGTLGRMSMWSITTWLIAINIAVFVADTLAGNVKELVVPAVTQVVPARLGDREILVREVILPAMPIIKAWGYFSVDKAIYGYQIWRFLSFQFLHRDVMHLFFNMLSLYFFGAMVESYLGSRRFLIYYLLSGIGGALGYLALWAAGYLIPYSWVPLIGASAGVFGILVAAARVAPNATVMLMFPPIPMRLKTLVWIFLAIAAYTVLSRGPNAGGEAAHLGGAAIGAALITNPRILDFFTLPWPRRRRQFPNMPWSG